jgi:hypothetical protein
MSEDLYPHEAMLEWLSNNVFRLDSAISYFCAGYTFCNYIQSTSHSVSNLVLPGLCFVVGWMWQMIDYNHRGLK